MLCLALLASQHIAVDAGNPVTYDAFMKIQLIVLYLHVAINHCCMSFRVLTRVIKGNTRSLEYGYRDDVVLKFPELPTSEDSEAIRAKTHPCNALRDAMKPYTP